MQAELEEVLLLQDEWSAKNTDPMRRRGVLIRQTLPEQIREILPDLSAHPTLSDIAVEGRDGTGLKTEIPWTRLYSLSRSPSATQGWYVAHLFSATGDRVYLSLNQGTTRWEGGEFKPRAPEELAARVAWARALLGLPDRPDLALDISLEARRSNLGRQYELGNVVSFVYQLNAIPADAQLHADLRTMAGWLATIYAAEESSLEVPGEPAAEIADALVAVRQAAGSGRRAGQGFRLSTVEKLAIERHAVSTATRYYTDRGFKVRDVGATHPYDLDVVRGSERLSVEVKGTTSPGAQVILTYGEVNHHRERFPSNALVVVHSIRLDRSTDPPVAAGGELSVTTPWSIDDADLTPIAYTYATDLPAPPPAP